MIDAGKVEADVGGEHPGVGAAGLEETAQSAMAAVAEAIGKGGAQEAAFQGRNDGGAEGVMHDAVAIGSGGDGARLGITNRETPIRAGLIAEGAQLLLELKQLGFQTTVEGQHIGPEALAPLGGFGSGEQAREAGEAGIEIVKEGGGGSATAHRSGRGHQAAWRRCCCCSQPLSWRATASSSRLACS